MTHFYLLKDFKNQYEVHNSLPKYYKKDRQNINVGIYTEHDGIIIGINWNVCKKHKLMAKQFFPNYSERKLIFNKNGEKFEKHLDNLIYKL